MMGEKKLVPKRRFEGFTEEWRKQQLNSIFNRIRNGFVGTATPYYVNFGNFYLQSNNVKNGKINRETEVFINNEFYKKQEDKLLRTGDLVMVQSGHVGHTAVIPQELDKTAAHALIMFQGYKKEANPYFYNYQFQTIKVKKRLSSVTTGNTIRHILASDMGFFEMNVTSIKEQQKIGQFFKHLDEMIALQQRKIDKTKALKSAYLAEMFPAEGERVPKRRFEGFIEPWRKSKFGDLTTIRRGLTYHPSSLTKTGVRVLRSSNINEDIFELRSDDIFVKNEAINIEEVNENDILITAANGSSRLIGKHALIKDINTRTVHGGFMLLARSQEPDFINALMNASWYKNFIKVFVSGGNGSIGNIRKGDLENQVVFVPCKKEQQKIGQFFKHLDEMIATHQQKLEKLKATKQAYLHEMFV